MKQFLMAVCLLFFGCCTNAQLAAVIFAPSKEDVVKPLTIPKELLMSTPYDDCFAQERAKCFASPFCSVAYILCRPCLELQFSAYCLGKTGGGSGSGNKR